MRNWIRWPRHRQQRLTLTVNVTTGEMRECYAGSPLAKRYTFDDVMADELLRHCLELETKHGRRPTPCEAHHDTDETVATG